MLAVNQVLQNRYRIIRQLGEGGMGAVYEAEDEQRFGKKVALKEILLNLTEANSEHFRRAFEREAKILTQIDHEAVPKVIGYILETDYQVLVMELIKGEDLDKILERQKNPFRLREVLDWTNQLLDALDYLHTLRQPIIHRDIKPQNLKLTSRGKIKLLDFGIAKDSEAELSTTKSAHKTMVGATRYYSPVEQIIRIPEFFETLNSVYPEKAQKVSRQSADARSDIYALGATLYNLLTNHYPKPADLRALEIWAGRSDSLKPLRDLNPQISPEIAEVLAKAMSIERENRFSSAHEMQMALQEAVLDETRRRETEEKNLLFAEQAKIRREREELEAMRRKLAEEHGQKQIADAEEKPITDTFSATTIPLEINSEKIVPELEKKFTESTVSDNIALDSEKSKVVTIENKAQTAPFVDVPTKSDKKKAFWALPFIALSIFILGVAGFGTLLLFNNSNSGVSNKTVSNSETVLPILTPTVSPLPTFEPSISPTDTPKQNILGSGKPKLTVAPTQNKTPIQTPIKTPRVRETATPKPTQDPNCVRTNSCK
ncbi:MAG TPA: protein kinase [Pyrinomonadaceae bacterium]|nr:protein kinase [Pyrinomonadaceae bacterium]